MSYIPDSLIPKGTIIPWWSTSTTPPTGWALCSGQTVTNLDGTTTVTPNLIGMFVQGSDVTSGSSSANSSGFSGGANQASVGSANHTHSISSAVGFTTGTSNTAIYFYLAGSVTVASPHTHSGTLSYSGSASSGSTQPASIAVPYLIKL